MAYWAGGGGGGGGGGGRSCDIECTSVHSVPIDPTLSTDSAVIKA